MKEAEHICSQIQKNRRQGDLKSLDRKKRVKRRNTKTTKKNLTEETKNLKLDENEELPKKLDLDTELVNLEKDDSDNEKTKYIKRRITL